MVASLVLLGGPGSSSAQASARSPSPEELWNAYPLDPGGTTLTMEPAAPPAETDAARSQSPSDSDDASGFPAGVAIALAAAAFTAGLALGRRRETEPAMTVRAEPSVGKPSPAASERRFVWRDYPPPSRPAPPPPPPPGAAATTVAVAPQRSPWPPRTGRSWRAEVLRRPGEGVQVAFFCPGAQSLPPGDPIDDDPDLADALRDVQAALETEGWTPVGPHRFVWPHLEPPPGRGGRQ